jgi:putative salt-induced outer membrane protein
MHKTASILACLALISTPALADWTGKGEAGLVIASGNSDTETVNAKLRLAKEIEAWKHAFGGAALYASDDGVKTANRWELFGETDYNFSPKTFLFGAGRYEEDEFSGFEYQATLSGGVGRKFIDREKTKLVGTAGVGYKRLETRDSFDDAGLLIEEGGVDEEMIFRGTMDFDHRLTETTSVIDRFITESGADNTYLQNDLAVQVKINAVLALALGYSVRHNTDPPSGFKKTDTLTTVNLVYEIK